MSKKVEAWMPIYIGDYLGDTQRLTTEQHGAYLLLLFDYWRNGAPPDDDTVLQQITKLERAAWRKHKAVLAALFDVRDGLWMHKRVEQELESAFDNQQRRSHRAAIAANARWNADSNAPSMLDAMLDGCPPPSPSPTEDDKSSSGRTPRRKKSHEVTECPPGVEADTWQAYLDLRATKRSWVTAGAYKLILKALAESGISANDTIARSVMNGWVGVFPTGGQGNGRTGKPSGWLA